MLTDEHIIPEALGGPLVIQTVCKPCNDRLGHDVDVLLTENFLFQNIRLGLRLRSKSGGLPSPLKNGELLGVAASVASYSREVGAAKGRVKVVPRVERTVEAGRESVRVAGEEAEVAAILRKLEQRAARDGKRIVVQQESHEVVKGPVVQKESTENLLGLLRPMAKIVYELSTLWLGQQYVDDPEARSLRSIVAGQIVPVEADIAYFPPTSYFEAWPVPSYFHVAALETAGPSATVAVRLFGVAEARVAVTDNAQTYPTATARWLAIDPVAGTYMEGSESRPPAPLVGQNVAVVVESEGNAFTVRVLYGGVEETITRMSLGA